MATHDPNGDETMSLADALAWVTPKRQTQPPPETPEHYQKEIAYILLDKAGALGWSITWKPERWCFGVKGFNKNSTQHIALQREVIAFINAVRFVVWNDYNERLQCLEQKEQQK